LLLNAGQGFANYLWNNGKTTPVNLITAPGVYSVTGYFSNGCRSLDTIRINDKLCLNDIYMPSAFTPNNDGLNDIFKPVCSKTLKKFRLKIYNRWGTEIFVTTDITKGWNGYYNGSLQGDGIFIWICVYQFENEKETIRKGTVFLIK
jgi:gliding motility-associated-like protein